MQLQRRVALVTGAASGIGRATALLMAREGAQLALADIDTERLSETVEGCREAGADVLSLVMDQRDSASVDAAVDDACNRFGRIDVLANIAGIYPLQPVEKTTDDLWADVLAVNLSGTFYCCRAVLPRMVAQSSGVIINTSSGSAFRALPGSSAYATSKAGIIALSRVLATEGAPAVRVNVVAPGPIATPAQLEGAAAAPTGADLGVVLGRYGTPEEIAETFLFLASERASWITGQVFHVNGGRFMG